MKTGKLYGVGVGPGDGELMTVKACKVIELSDVIAAPRTKGDTNLALSIAQSMVDLSEKQLLYLDFPMTKDQKILKENYRKVGEKLGELLDQGKKIAFLTLGDVSIYSTCSYLLELVGKMGFETEVVPGVTSFCASAATLKISLTEADQPIHILPAIYSDIPATLKLDGTKIYMKAGRKTGELFRLAKEDGQQIFGIENCGMSNERMLLGDEKSSGYFTTIVVKEGKL
ncbi:MAG: precorrin-2 C(20)-methyltransferase [Clostridiales bacterium]|nr:precorrin-2 C(20)-methyltransferase [Clostridiales bacterium]